MLSGFFQHSFFFDLVPRIWIQVGFVASLWMQHSKSSNQNSEKKYIDKHTHKFAAKKLKRIRIELERKKAHIHTLRTCTHIWATEFIMVIRLQIKCMNKFALFPIGMQQKAKGTDYTHNYHMCAFAKFFFFACGWSWYFFVWNLS